MKRRSFMLLFVIITFSSLVIAQSGVSFNINKSTIDGGGGSSSGGEFSLQGTIGQADVNSTKLSSGGFTLTSGFWASENSVNNDLIFMDGFE
jgi:hypothetical protein